MLKHIFNAAAISILFLLTVFFVSAANATEEYAVKTGSECQACHIDPLGGGALTEYGKGYLLSIHPENVQRTPTPESTSHLIRLIFGYIHIVTAFFWFGTILYVHLILKPAYASKGLPPVEVKIGLVSMALMAVTGGILTYYKVSSVDLLLSSRFGILLLIKIALFALMVSSAAFVVLVVGPKLKKKQRSQFSKSDQLSKEELDNFDGRYARPAYIAFKEEIYDVTQSELWKSGEHMKKHQAGIDLTDVISQAPHGEDKILAMPKVGQLSTKKPAKPREWHKRLFYFIAYVNLVFVLIILLILALWRWPQ